MIVTVVLAAMVLLYLGYRFYSRFMAREFALDLRFAPTRDIITPDGSSLSRVLPGLADTSPGTGHPAQSSRVPRRFVVWCARSPRSRRPSAGLTTGSPPVDSPTVSDLPRGSETRTFRITSRTSLARRSASPGGWRENAG